MNQLRKLLNVPNKIDDYTSVLQAISKIIGEKLSSSAVQSYLLEKQESNKSADQAVQLTLDEINLGFDTNGKD